MTKNILLLCIALMGISAIAQNTHVPDDNFEQALIDLGYDSGALDDYVPTANINSITSLNLNRKGIKDLTGIENFIALTFLNVASNQLSSVDISKNVALNTLVLSSNLLKTVDLSKNLALEKLYLDNNPIASVDFSNNPLLSDIRIERAKLTSIDVSKNTALKTLYAHTNLLTTIDLSKNVLLEDFYGGNNKLTNIDLSKNTALKELDVGNNQLSTIDVSMLSNLEYLYVHNNKLKALDVSKKEKLISLTISNNQINEVDISSSTLLQSLSANDNELKSISFLQNSSLRYLFLQSNKLTSLDLSKNINLVSVNLESNNLTSLNIKTGNIIKINPRNFNITKNPNLLCVEVDNPEWFTANFTNKDAITVYKEDCTTVEKKTYVPDDNFEQALIDLGYDSGALDNYVPTANIKEVVSLQLGFKENINDFTGLEDFLMLEDLDISGHDFNSIDLSKNITLKKLALRETEVPTLDLSKNTKLEEIQGYSTKFKNLDLSKNIALKAIFIHEANIETIEITNCIELDNLVLFDNNIEELNVSKNTKLKFLNVQNNKLKSLDLSANINLETLVANNNQLTELNIKNGNNTKITTKGFYITKNLNLKCIQVDNPDWSNANWMNKDATAVYKEDCSVSEEKTYVPDDNFEQALIDLGYDSGTLDDYVPTANINTLTNLTLRTKGIKNLTGIEAFTALEYIDVANNELTNLDVSQNLNLISIIAYNNKITSIDVSKNLALINLHLAINQLTTLDVTKNTNIKTLFLFENKLTSLDVSKQLGLTQLSAYQNQLTTLDLTVNTALISVYLQSNKLVSLTIKNGNNTKIVKDKFHVNNNPELACVQVDNAAWSKSNWINKDGKAVFKENCSLPIAQTYVPDDNFEQALIDLGYDSGVIDDYVPTENISVIDALNVSDKGITDLTGIEDFATLIQLEARNNNLKTVDISKNITLKRVSFEGNKLTAIELSTLVALQYINLKKNELSTIDLSKNTKLQDVFISNNPNLINVNLKNGNNEEIAVFQSRNTPKLTCVQVSNVEWSTKVWVEKDEAITYSENCALSVNDLELNNEINLYPNPVINKMYITNLSTNPKSIHVYTLLGKSVFKTSVKQGKNEVNLESLTSGVYLVKIGNYVKRIVKK